jgi:co-chaperonin GroES (HSP10)
LDGSLTGLGPKTWATPFFEHNNQPECEKQLDVYDGLLCHSSVEVRRIAFFNYVPDIFSFMPLNLLKLDTPEYTALNKTNGTEVNQYLADSSKYGFVPFKAKLDPSNAWAVPMVTGHKYRAHWGSSSDALDFTQMQISLSNRWNTTDKGIYLVMNFTDVREKIEVITGGEIIENMTLVNKTAPLLQTGDNIIYNDTATREIHLMINGRNMTRNKIKLVGYRCVSSCFAAIVDVPLETSIRYWSDVNNWPKGALPKEGEDVEIKSGWNMIYDIPETPLLNKVEINGRL